MAGIPIESRNPDEVTEIAGALVAPDGRAGDGGLARVRVAPPGTPAANPAFDVTPARLVTGLITEYGVVAADREALSRLRRSALDRAINGTGLAPSA